MIRWFTGHPTAANLLLLLFLAAGAFAAPGLLRETFPDFRAVEAEIPVTMIPGPAGLIMAVVGFVPDAPVQPEGAVTGMRLAYILVPTVGALLAIWVMRDYDVTEERAKKIRAELERRRGKKLLA